MKAFVKRLNTPSAQKKALEWGKLIFITGSAQLLIQAIGLVSGILIIRLLSSQEYALYTLANTMLGTMVVLADGGISTGVMSQGGKVWSDRQKLGVVIATGLDLRKKFAMVSLLLAIPALIYLQILHQANWLTAALIVLSIIPSFFSSLSGTLLQIAPKLRQDIGPLQKNQIEINLIRITLLALTLFAFPFTFVALLAAGLPQVWGNLSLRKISNRYASSSEKPDPLVSKEMIKLVRRILPGSIYYCLSGQITIWLISIMGSTIAVAQIGALGRLSTLLTLFSIMFSTIVLPRFARLENGSKLVFKRFNQIQIGLLLLNVCIVGLVWLFSSQILWLLGYQYANLSTELILSVTGSGISLMAGLSFSLFTSRGWAIYPLLSIPVSIISIAIGILIFDTSTLSGVLLFNIFVAFIQYVINTVYCLIKIVAKEKSKY